MVETAEGWGIIQKAACWYLVVFRTTLPYAPGILSGNDGSLGWV